MADALRGSMDAGEYDDGEPLEEKTTEAKRLNAAIGANLEKSGFFQAGRQGSTFDVKRHFFYTIRIRTIRIRV